MRFPRKRGSTSNMVRVFIPDNTSTTGAGITGLTSSSTNLVIAYMRELDSTSTTYTGANIETITTIGTFAAPSSSSKIRFKAVDATNLPGVYELQFHDSSTAFGTGDTSSNITINILETSTTALKIGPNMTLISLTPWDWQDGVRLGLTALPNAAAGASSGLPLSADSSGRVDVLKINGTSQTARDLGASVLLSSGTGTGQVSLSSGLVSLSGTQTFNVTGNITGNVSGSVGSVTGAVGSVTGNVGGNVVGSVGSLTANNDKTGYRLSSTGVDDIVNTALTEGYAADGAAPTLSQLQFMMWSLMAEKNIATTTLTAKKLDGSTTAMTFTLNDATSPTSITRAS